MTDMRTPPNQNDSSDDEQAKPSDGGARDGVQSIEVGASLND
jgi:hypothetical protein